MKLDAGQFPRGGGTVRGGKVCKAEEGDTERI